VGFVYRLVVRVGCFPDYHYTISKGSFCSLRLIIILFEPLSAAQGAVYNEVHFGQQGYNIVNPNLATKTLHRQTKTQPHLLRLPCPEPPPYLHPTTANFPPSILISPQVPNYAKMQELTSVIGFGACIPRLRPIVGLSSLFGKSKSIQSLPSKSICSSPSAAPTPTSRPP
jgi:hypothetical protein